MKNAPFRFVNIRRSTCVSILALGLIFAAAGMASAQSFIVLHSFTGQGDGAWPMAGLTVDQAGNVYGTSTLGGNVSCSYTEFAGCGTVFKLARHNSSWLFSTLYAFNGGGDGANPLTPVTFGPDEMGSLKEIVLQGKFRYADGGSYRFVEDFPARYIADLTNRPKIARKLKAVAACGNGTAGAFAPKILDARLRSCPARYRPRLHLSKL